MYVSLILDEKKNDNQSFLSRQVTDNPDDGFLLLLLLMMMMVTMMTISTRNMDDNDAQRDNNYDIKIYVLAPINRKFQKNPKCFNLAEIIERFERSK